MYLYGWFTLFYSKKWHSSVKQLYSNKKKKGQLETLAWSLYYTFPFGGEYSWFDELNTKQVLDINGIQFSYLWTGDKYAC